MSLIATIISPNGEVDSVSLPEDEEARLHQLQDLVGGYIEVVALPGERHMVINENGKDGPHTINQAATAIAHEAQAIMLSDYIAGPAIVISQDDLQ